MRFFERLLTPLSQWIGFRMDLPESVVTRTPGLVVDAAERVNLFGHWTLLRMRRQCSGSTSSRDDGSPSTAS